MNNYNTRKWLFNSKLVPGAHTVWKLHLWGTLYSSVHSTAVSVWTCLVFQILTINVLSCCVIILMLWLLWWWNYWPRSYYNSNINWPWQVAKCRSKLQTRLNILLDHHIWTHSSLPMIISWYYISSAFSTLLNTSAFIVLLSHDCENVFHEISGSHGGEYEDDNNLVGCIRVYTALWSM
jgi:hypothetical protein